MRDHFSKFVLACCVLSLLGCLAPRLVPVDSGNPPSIKLGFNLFDGGQVSEAEFNEPNTRNSWAEPIWATRYTPITLSGNAADLTSGVKSFEITVSDYQGNVLYHLLGTDSLDAQGKGVENMGFIGSDGGSGFGVKVPVKFVMTTGFVSVKAIATNYSGESNNVEVAITPLDPAAVNIDVNPKMISAGDSVTVTWGMQNVFSVTTSPQLTGLGAEIFKPTSTTTYTITGYQSQFPGPTAVFLNPPPATGQTIHSTTASASTTVTVRGSTPPPPSEVPSGWFGTVNVCNPGTTSATLKLAAHIVPPASAGPAGQTTMTETDPVAFTLLGNGVWHGSFHTQQIYKQGTWQITSAQVQGVTGVKTVWPTYTLPGSLGNPPLDFTGGPCQ